MHFKLIWLMFFYEFIKKNTIRGIEILTRVLVRVKKGYFRHFKSGTLIINVLFGWESVFHRMSLSGFERKMCEKLGCLDEGMDGKKTEISKGKFIKICEWCHSYNLY